MRNDSSRESLLATDQPVMVHEKNRYLVFQLADGRYAIPIEDVVEVVRAVEVTPIPDAPESVAGIVNRGGHVVPVISARERLGLETRAVIPSEYMIITSVNSLEVAVIIDALEGIVASDTRVTASSEYSHALIRGVLRVDNEVIPVCQVAGALQKKDWDYCRHVIAGMR